MCRISDLKDAWVVVPTASPLTLFGLCRRMTVNYCKFNQVVTPVAGAVLNVVSLLEQIYTCPGVWNTAVDLANVFFSIPVQ